MRTKPVSAAQVRAYAGKAEEYAAAAASELDAGRFVAATSLAIHAAINAADAVCGARLGHRAAGEGHDQLLVLLRQAGKDGAEIESDLRRLLRPPAKPGQGLGGAGAEIESDLRRLLPLKTKAQYEPDDVAPSVATKAVERAQRCILVSRRVADAVT